MALPITKPIDGQFLASADKRLDWCAANDHPVRYLNVSKSMKRKDGKQVFQCHCGRREEANAKGAK